MQSLVQDYPFAALDIQSLCHVTCPLKGLWCTLPFGNDNNSSYLVLMPYSWAQWHMEIQRMCICGAAPFNTRFRGYLPPCVALLSLGLAVSLVISDKDIFCAVPYQMCVPEVSCRQRSPQYHLCAVACRVSLAYVLWTLLQRVEAPGARTWITTYCTGTFWFIWLVSTSGPTNMICIGAFCRIS